MVIFVITLSIVCLKNKQYVIQFKKNDKSTEIGIKKKVTGVKEMKIPRKNERINSGPSVISRSCNPFVSYHNIPILAKDAPKN
jgi:hypothetical protein